MTEKRIYFAPQSTPVAIRESSVLCQSIDLDPILDNPDVIEWDDVII